MAKKRHTDYDDEREPLSLAEEIAEEVDRKRRPEDLAIKPSFHPSLSSALCWTQRQSPARRNAALSWSSHYRTWRGSASATSSAAGSFDM